MKKTKRSKEKYPGLNKQVSLKIRSELIDQDYIDKLSDKEKKWLSNFNEEWVAANLSHPGKKLHTTKKEKKKVYDMNNARNRDAYGKAKISGKLGGVENYHPEYNPEDSLIEKLDAELEIVRAYEELKGNK